VKKIVDDHHGAIACDTDTTGTTFRIRIPLQLARASQM
jgi:nitrogen-specific signal transduction histidine kinase